ncbi:MAG: glycosyltransferase [Acidobacteriia bacterium]|nr:glycosyltransferase [Terriglobia bacterium]
MSIRVLFVVSSLRIGGAEHVLTEILKRVDRRILEPHLALLEREGNFLERVPPDVRVHDVGARRARMATLPLARLCWRLRPQAVVSFAAQLNSAAILAMPLMPRGTRVLVREGANVTLPEIAGSARRTIYKLLYPHADTIICQSNDMVERMAHCFGIPAHKLVRIYNPVDVDALEQIAGTHSPYRGTGPHLVAVGRFVPVKGMDLLVEALPVVLRDHSHADLTLVGGGPQERELHSLARSLGIESLVHFAGFQGNPYPFIRHSDLLVVPSRSEVFPNVILEAVALGTPVVATDCPGGIREIAQRTKRLVLTRVDSDALAHAINRKLAGITARRSPHEAEDDFLREFSPERIIPLYQEIIERTVRRSEVPLTARKKEEAALT